MDFASVYQYIKDLGGSNFFTACAGAYAGAYGAQVIAERSKSKDELMKEIRNTNAALAVSFTIYNTLLSMKIQHVKALKETHDAQKAAILEHAKLRKLEKIPANIGLEYKTDFQTLSLPHLPVEILQKQLFEKLSLKGRALNLTTTLAQTISSLDLSLEKRNRLIEMYKSSDLSQDALRTLYFGFPYGEGHVNQDYPAAVNAIYSQTDDGIFFSQLLCKDLVKHGEQLIKQFNRKFRKGAPDVDKPDFSKAIGSKLMPPDEAYSDWLTMFVEKPKPPLSRFERMREGWYFWDKNTS